MGAGTGGKLSCKSNATHPASIYTVFRVTFVATNLLKTLRTKKGVGGKGRGGGGGDGFKHCCQVAIIP